MGDPATVIYLASKLPDALAPYLQSLPKDGLRFKALAPVDVQLTAWGLPAEALNHDVLTQVLLQPNAVPGTRRIVMLPIPEAPTAETLAWRDACIAAMVALAAPDTLLVTDVAQCGLLHPELLSEESHWAGLARQLYQDVVPGLVLPLRRTMPIGDTPRALYSINPAWPAALEVPREGTALTEAQLRDVLAGTAILLQLARTAELHTYQALLMRNGVPVQVACAPDAIATAVGHVIFQDGFMSAGSTLVVSHPLSDVVMKRVVSAGIAVVVATAWLPEALKELNDQVIPVSFSLERLRLSTAALSSAGPGSLLWQDAPGADRVVRWATAKQPTTVQRQDLEMGLAVLDALPTAAAGFFRLQASVALRSGLPTASEAVDIALSRATGETPDSVAIVRTTDVTPDLYAMLTQAGIAGVLFVSDPDTVLTLPDTANLPFFVGFTDVGEAADAQGSKNGQEARA